VFERAAFRPVFRAWHGRSFPGFSHFSRPSFALNPVRWPWRILRQSCIKARRHGVICNIVGAPSAGGNAADLGAEGKSRLTDATGGMDTRAAPLNLLPLSAAKGGNNGSVSIHMPTTIRGVPMKLLSGMDSLFLHMEQGNQCMHVAGLGIYDPSTAPGGRIRFKQILDFFARRLDSAKIFRRRLAAAPLGLDRPYWIDEGEIDTEYHVRHIALPQPGDWRQLMIQVARIHSRPLDRSRPLWEA
jgi:hypothetical protein